MNIEAVGALGVQDEVGPATLPGAVAGPALGAGFGQRVSEALHSVNDELLAAQVDLQRLATGDSTNLHEVMVHLEESRISLQLLLQVRSRVLEAYQDVMKMQI